MNTKQEQTKSTHLPEDFFEGKDLIMAKAIYAGDLAAIEKLIKVENFNVNTRGSHVKTKYSKKPVKYTYLGYSVLAREIGSAEKLLELGADVDRVSLDKGIYTNIGMACSKKDKELIDLLLKYKVNLNPPLAGSPFDALLTGDTDRSLFDLLLSSGADVDHKDYIGGGGALTAALYVEKVEYMNYFLDKKADPMQLDYNGNSFAYLIQKELDEGRLMGNSLKEYQKIKERLATEFQVKFPLKNEFIKGREEAIVRYENLSEEDKEFLGQSEVERIKLFKEGLKIKKQSEDQLHK